MSNNKQAPEIVSLYALNVAPSMIRLKIRQDFEKNKEITDLPIIDMLLHKNQQEYQETMNCWKQEVGLVLHLPSRAAGCRLSARRGPAYWLSRTELTIQPHLLHWFKSYEDPPAPQTFLEKFYAGRDDPKQVGSF